MSSENLDKICESLSSLNILQVSELCKMLEDKWGVTAAVAAVAAPAAGGAAPAAAEEKTEFNVVLKSFGANKIAVIKVIRTVTSLGLKEAKDLVEAAPKTVKEDASKEDAKKIKEDLEGAGAEVELT